MAASEAERSSGMGQMKKGEDRRITIAKGQSEARELNLNEYGSEESKVSVDMKLQNE